MYNLQTAPGLTMPQGAVVINGGVEFTLFSQKARRVTLLLFDKVDDTVASHRIPMNSDTHKNGDNWHAFVEELGHGQLYLYQVEGPWNPSEGHRFSDKILLIDPYAKALQGTPDWTFRHSLAHEDTPDISKIPKCMVIDNQFDWQNDTPLNYPLSETVIYEIHVKGLTAHSNTQKKFDIKSPGTYAGVVEMIPYLKDLGITSLELLPVMEFDENEFADILLPETNRPKTNYWGYSTAAFFAPKGSYAVSTKNGAQITEFKTMVRELHKAGIEVILDIVFNHTGENNHIGPTFSFRGLGNSVYYMLEDDKQYYKNYSGCGNTVNCNHPVVRKFIIDCLHYWVHEMHVDGFRFDLASVLGRDEDGHFSDKAPLLDEIVKDPMLLETKMIAEPWDAGGGYILGAVNGGKSGRGWAEWNDKYRDDIRRFWHTETEGIKALGYRITGSSDVFALSGRKPYHSINYITAHDGFTLSDLVSYGEKHNLANGENNQDGSNWNLCRNWGVEGETQDVNIESRRSCMTRNFLATLLLSSGTPMLLGGDEIRRTQQGNNNAYCQDNEISWYDFSRLDKYSDLQNFVKQLLVFRQTHPCLHRQDFFSDIRMGDNQYPDIFWADANGNAIDWENPENILTCRIFEPDNDDIIMCFNASAHDQLFRFPPPLSGYQWLRTIDTALPAPLDILKPGREIHINPQDGYMVASKSLLVVLASPKKRI